MGIKNFLNDIRSKVEGIRKKGKPDVRVVEDGTKAVKLSDEAYSLLDSLFDELGGRPAATVESRKAARRIAAEMGKYSDDVTLTSGRIYPFVGKAMMFFLYVFSLIEIFFIAIGLPYLSLIAAAAYLYAFYGEIRKDGGWLRAFMRTGEAANVHAVIDSEEEAERTIIFSAHHDSAPVVNERDGKFWKAVSHKYVQPSVFCLISLSAVISAIAEIAGGKFWGFNLPSIPVMAAIILLAALSAVSFIAHGWKDDEYSPGAGDDLSGVSVVVTLLSYFSKEKKAGKGLRRTRLIFASFDGEECGRAGSKLWYQDNQYLIRNAVNLNFDGLYSEDDLVFLTADGNGLVPLSSSLATHCSAIASAMGYKTGVGRLGFLAGETDAATASLSSVEATTLTAMAPGTVTAAHSADDTPDKVSEEALSRAISIGIRLASEDDSRTGIKESSVFDADRKYKLSRY